MITEIEQETSDIDWFFTNNDSIAFVASGGGKLPLSIAKSSENNKILASFFNSLSKKSGVEINPDLNKILSFPADENYLSDFINMSGKGLYTFDKTALGKFLDTNYHLVASPLNPLKFEDIPPEVKEIIAQYPVNMESSINVDLMD